MVFFAAIINNRSKHLLPVLDPFLDLLLEEKEIKHLFPDLPLLRGMSLFTKMPGSRC
jgi:hypothetical protein